MINTISLQTQQKSGTYPCEFALKWTLRRIQSQVGVVCAAFVPKWQTQFECVANLKLLKAVLFALPFSLHKTTARYDES